MMTLEEYLYLIVEYKMCNSHFRQVIFTEIVPESNKSIFTRFYENCRNKSENFCVDCFKKLADYCKE